MTRKTADRSHPAPARKTAKRPAVPPPADRPADDDANVLESLGRAVASPVLESEPEPLQGGAPAGGQPERPLEHKR